MTNTERAFYCIQNALIPIARKARDLKDRPDIDQPEIRGLLKDIDTVAKKFGIDAKGERRRSDDTTE